MSQYIQALPHEPRKPVEITREHNDVVVIEGVRYAGDYFREFGHPDTDVLYSVFRDADGVVRLTIIRTPEEAKEFFEGLWRGAPAVEDQSHAV